MTRIQNSSLVLYGTSTGDSDTRAEDTDIVTAKYISGDWSKSVAISSLEQALEIVKVNLPNKLIEQSSNKHM